MTLAETKELVKTGKRKVRDWEEDPEVTEWRTRMEEKVERMEERISEVKETVERVERMLTLGVLGKHEDATHHDHETLE